MNTIVSKMLVAGTLFLLVFVSGYWLARSGRPYSQAIFTVHKLIALGAVIFLGVLIARLNGTAPLEALHWLAAAAVGLFLAGLFVTGGLLSAMKAPPGLVLAAHQALPYLAVIAVGVSFYRLAVR